MGANILTIEDLQQFKREFFDELKKTLFDRPATSKWIKSHQVKRILTISPGTLQQLRAKGMLPFTKIGGVIYYDVQDIDNMLQQHKQNTKVRNA